MNHNKVERFAFQLHNYHFNYNDQSFNKYPRSKMSQSQWAGRTDSNKWVIFDKQNLKIGDSVLIKIEKAIGLSLKGTIQS